MFYGSKTLFLRCHKAKARLVLRPDVGFPRFINSDSQLLFFKDSEILRVCNLLLFKDLRPLKIFDPKIGDFSDPVTLGSTGAGWGVKLLQF